MTNQIVEKRDRRLTVLLRDHGYEVQGTALIQKGVRGFTSDKIFCRVRSLFHAAEYLIPIIKEDDYSQRFRDITKPLD